MTNPKEFCDLDARFAAYRPVELPPGFSDAVMLKINRDHKHRHHRDIALATATGFLLGALAYIVSTLVFLAGKFQLGDWIKRAEELARQVDATIFLIATHTVKVIFKASDAIAFSPWPDFAMHALVWVTSALALCTIFVSAATVRWTIKKNATPSHS